MANPNARSLEDRIGELYELEKVVEENQREMEERIERIDQLIEEGHEDGQSLEAQIDFIMEAAHLIETNIQEEAATDEKIESIEEEVNSGLLEKASDRLKGLFNKVEEEEAEEESREEKTDQQIRELYELVEIFIGRHDRHIDPDHGMALRKLKAFLQDQKVPELELP